MSRFTSGLVLGFVAGSALGAGAAWLVLGRGRPIADVQLAPPVGTPPSPPPRPKRRGPRPAGATGPVEASVTPTEETDPLIILAPAELAQTTAGDALRADTTLDMAGGAAVRDLTQEEIDGALAQRTDALVRCLTQARGAAPVAGRVVVGVVVAADGRVTRTRVEAPAYLLHHGLYDCARRSLLAVRFPAVGKETVVTVPFDVHE